MGLQHTQRAWGWCPPPELGTVASWCLVSRRPSARALLCRAASHWRCSSRGSSARSRCTGSHARSTWYLHRWDYSTPSGSGSWRPPPELGTVASWYRVSRRPSARARLCRAASHWRCSSRSSSACLRCTGSQDRSAWYLHRWGYFTASGAGGWRPPPELGTVAAWRQVSRRPSARARLCRAASHWRCSFRGSSACLRCTGSHARSSWYLHRGGYSNPSRPGPVPAS